MSALFDVVFGEKKETRKLKVTPFWGVGILRTRGVYFKG